MICGNKLYKGEDVVLSVPFEVSGYTNLLMSVYTDGATHVYANNPVVEDGMLIATFHEHSIDILNDGVLRYSISYSVEGIDYTISTNAPYVLKTPEDYNAKTADDIYQEGYAAGQADCPECSGGTCNLETGSYSLPSNFTGITIEPSQGYDGFSEMTISDGGYGTAKYNEGYAAGQQGDCNLEEGTYVLQSDFEGDTIYPDTGYNGFSQLTISDEGYGSAKYDEGYNVGISDGYSGGYTQGEIAGMEQLINQGYAVPALSGSVSFSSDVTLTMNDSIIVEYVSLSGQGYGVLDEAYIEIDGQLFSNMKGQGVTVTAGTHTLYIHLAEEPKAQGWTKYKVKELATTIEGVTFNTELVMLA